MGTIVKGVTVTIKGQRGTRTVFPQQTTTGDHFALGTTFVANAPQAKKQTRHTTHNKPHAAPSKQPAHSSRAASGGSSGKRTQFYNCGDQSVRIK